MTVDKIVKMVPTALVAGVVCYCAWPYVVGETPEEAARVSKPAELPLSLLHPTVLPMPPRNPFQDAATAKLAAQRRTETTKKAIEAKARGASENHTAAAGAGS